MMVSTQAETTKVSLDQRHSVARGQMGYLPDMLRQLSPVGV